MAVALLTKIFAPYLWGWLADHQRRRLTLIRWGALTATLAYTLIFYAHDYATYAAVLFLFSFFWNAALPQVEALTLSNLQDRAHRYGLIRLWGSVGFIVMNIGGGWLVARWGADVVPWLMVSLLSSRANPTQHRACPA